MVYRDGSMSWIAPKWPTKRPNAMQMAECDDNSILVVTEDEISHEEATENASSTTSRRHDHKRPDQH